MKAPFLPLVMLMATVLFAEDAACEDLVLQTCTFDKVCASYDEKRHVKDCTDIETPRVFEFCGTNKINPLEKPSVTIRERKNGLSGNSQLNSPSDYTVTEHINEDDGLTIAWTVADGPEGTEQSHVMSVALLMGVAFLLTSNDPIPFEHLKGEELPVPVYTGICFPKIAHTCEVPE